MAGQPAVPGVMLWPGSVPVPRDAVIWQASVGMASTFRGLNQDPPAFPDPCSPLGSGEVLVPECQILLGTQGGRR